MGDSTINVTYLPGHKVGASSPDIQPQVSVGNSILDTKTAIYMKKNQMRMQLVAMQQA